MIKSHDAFPPTERSLDLPYLADLAMAADSADLAGEARDLERRYAAREVCVACIGQFKRGKSTLINALLEADVLPTGTLPVTSAPLLVRYGDADLRVRYGDRWEQLPLTELTRVAAGDGTTREGRTPDAIELYYPANVLANGLCLLDTPGMGSVQVSHDAGTRSALPRIDAALIVVGADPPITWSEIELIRNLHTGISHVILVLTKADRVTPDEAASGLTYAKETILRETGRVPAATFIVSAAGALAQQPSRQWNALVEHLTRLPGAADQAGRQDHAARHTHRIAATFRTRIDQRLALLLDPVAAAAARAEALQGINAKASRETERVASRVGSETGAAMRQIWEARSDFIARITPEVDRQYRAAFERGWWSRTARNRRAIMRVAAPIARVALGEWEAFVRTQIIAALSALTASALAEMEELRDALSQESGMTLAPLEESLSETGNDLLHRYYFHDLEHEFSGLGQIPEVLLWALPASLRMRRQYQSGDRYLTALIDRNSVIAVADVDMWLLDVRRKLNRLMREMLTEIGAEAVRQAEAAARLREAGATAVQAEVTQLRALRHLLDAPVAVPDGHSPREGQLP